MDVSWWDREILRKEYEHLKVMLEDGGGAVTSM